MRDVQIIYSRKSCWQILKESCFLFLVHITEAVVWKSSAKRVLLKISQNPQENTSARAFFKIKLQACLKNFAKFTGKHLCQSLFFNKVVLTQMFSCEFYNIFKNTFTTFKKKTPSDIKLTTFMEYSFCSVAWNFPKKRLYLICFLGSFWKLYEPQFLRKLLLTLTPFN